MNKPRVLFPYTEAGLGHIEPMNSIAAEFERLYGDRVECIRSQFFTEGGNKKLAIFEKRLMHEVVRHNKSRWYGHFATFSMEFWRVRLSSWATMKFLKLGSRRFGYRHMDELHPDLVVSTHWATNYYAINCKSKPLTAMYCPDAEINPLFSYFSDLVMVSMRTGYEKAFRKHPRRFNEDNLKLVPFLIRNQAFEVPADDKKGLRRKLGLDEDKFTIILAEGGYGIGKMERIVEIILERDLPVNLVPVCGKNTALYEKFKTLKSKGKVTFKPMGLIDNMLEVVASGDIFCGKSGASSCAEACFFGLPHIITKYATNIEEHIGEYYLNVVGNALKIFDPEKAVKKIEEFLREPELMTPYIEAARTQKNNYGATECAKLIYELLCTRFPELKETE